MSSSAVKLVVAALNLFLGKALHSRVTWLGKKLVTGKVGPVALVQPAPPLVHLVHNASPDQLCSQQKGPCGKEGRLHTWVSWNTRLQSFNQLTHNIIEQPKHTAPCQTMSHLGLVEHIIAEATHSSAAARAEGWQGETLAQDKACMPEPQASARQSAARPASRGCLGKA